MVPYNSEFLLTLFPPWSTYRAVLLYTRSIGTRPLELPFVWKPQKGYFVYLVIHFITGNGSLKLTHSSDVAARGSDAAHGHTDASCRFRDECTLLQGVVDSFNAVIFHRQEETTREKKKNTTMWFPLFQLTYEVSSKLLSALSRTGLNLKHIPQGYWANICKVFMSGFLSVINVYKKSLGLNNAVSKSHRLYCYTEHLSLYLNVFNYSIVLGFLFFLFIAKCAIFSFSFLAISRSPTHV